MPKIAILGWGSLLWDYNELFDDQHERDYWPRGGPTLPLEFSRISEKRNGALTLVIDIDRGEACRVAYTMSKRKHTKDAICDLRTREGTTLENIGFYCVKKNIKKSRNPQVLDIIKNWTKEKRVDAVIWTDLETNFPSVRREKFVDKAVTYIQELDGKGKASAAEYIWRAPEFVNTPLRRKLQRAPWF